MIIAISCSGEKPTDVFQRNKVVEFLDLNKLHYTQGTETHFELTVRRSSYYLVIKVTVVKDLFVQVFEMCVGLQHGLLHCLEETRREGNETHSGATETRALHRQKH